MRKYFIIFKNRLWHYLAEIHATCHPAELFQAGQSFRQGWQEATQGKTYSLSELWAGIDAE